ncbi:MAG: ABC transporter permease [Eggerthellaceae bacterium]|nr:ABC transporter permease [Eggerthellaceae bacterium]
MRKIAHYVLSICFLLLFWHILSLFVNSSALPSPLQAIDLFIQNIRDIIPAFGVSAYRVVAGLFIGAELATPLGLYLGRHETADAIAAPLLYVLYPLPKIVLLPILLVFLGLADAPKIALIALTTFFQTLISVRDATKHVPPESIEVLRSLGASRISTYIHAVIPAALPDLFTALRVSSGTAIAILFFAESIAGSSGLGYFIIDSWGLLDYSRMFAGIIAMAIMGVVMYEIFDIVEKKLIRWKNN